MRSAVHARFVHHTRHVLAFSSRSYWFDAPFSRHFPNLLRCLVHEVRPIAIFLSSVSSCHCISKFNVVFAFITLLTMRLCGAFPFVLGFWRKNLKECSLFAFLIDVTHKVWDLARLWVSTLNRLSLSNWGIDSWVYWRIGCVQRWSRRRGIVDSLGCAHREILVVALRMFEIVYNNHLVCLLVRTIKTRQLVLIPSMELCIVIILIMFVVEASVLNDCFQLAIWLLSNALRSLFVHKGDVGCFLSLLRQLN